MFHSPRVLADDLTKEIPLSPKLYDAFCAIDRKYFVPSGFEFKAYSIGALPLTDDSTISSPLTVAKMSTFLELEKNVDSVLEIGCGSGYQAAILSRLVRRVFAIDRICKLVKEAKERFKALDLPNINAKCDDGMQGWKTFAPYDRILLSAHADNVDTLLDQLSDNGFILAPIKKGNEQIITKITKQTREEIETCEFVPIKQGTRH